MSHLSPFPPVCYTIIVVGTTTTTTAAAAATARYASMVWVYWAQTTIAKVRGTRSSPAPRYQSSRWQWHGIARWNNRVQVAASVRFDLCVCAMRGLLYLCVSDRPTDRTSLLSGKRVLFLLHRSAARHTRFWHRQRRNVLAAGRSEAWGCAVASRHRPLDGQSWTESAPADLLVVPSYSILFTSLFAVGKTSLRRVPSKGSSCIAPRQIGKYSYGSQPPPPVITVIKRYK